MTNSNSVSSTSSRISIVSPVYFGEKTLEKLTEEIITAVEPLGLPFEIIFVNDGSPDSSWEVITTLCQRDSRVKGIKLSRNFGQQAAVTAGIAQATGDYIVLLDCDLQDNPKYIPEMLFKAKEGYDIIYATITRRRHSMFRNISARLYYWLLKCLTHGKSQINAESRGYLLMTRKVADAFLSLKESHRLYMSILSWTGFSSSSVTVEHRDRGHGQTSYTYKKLFKLALDGIISQSNFLLSIGVGLGFFMCFISIIAAAYLIFAHFFGYTRLPGWTSLTVLILLCTGVILTTTGIIGLYIGKMFDEVKERPAYLIDQTINHSRERE